MTYLRPAAPLLGRAEHLEKTVIFVVEAEALAIPDAAAADLLHRASLAREEEAQAEAALSAATQATEAARKVVFNPQNLDFKERKRMQGAMPHSLPIIYTLHNAL